MKNVLLLFAGLPADAVVFILAAMPVGELRAAIPVGIIHYHLPIWEAFFWAQIGNAVPVFLIYALCNWWVELMERRRGWLHRLTDKVLSHTHAKMHGGFSKWGLVAVILFVAVPLPGMGAWTGTLGAYLLHIPLKKAFPAVILGNLIAGIIVTIATVSGVAAFDAIN